MLKGKAGARTWGLALFSMLPLIAASCRSEQPQELRTWEMEMEIQRVPSSLPYIPGVIFYPLGGERLAVDLIALLNSDFREVIDDAVSDPEWLAAKSDSPRDRRRFRARLDVSFASRQDVIIVRFSDERSEVARVGLKAFERSFLAMARTRSISQDPNVISLIEHQIAGLTAEQAGTKDPDRRRDLQRQIDELERAKTNCSRTETEGARVLSRRPISVSR